MGLSVGARPGRRLRGNVPRRNKLAGDGLGRGVAVVHVMSGLHVVAVLLMLGVPDHRDVMMVMMTGNHAMLGGDLAGLHGLHGLGGIRRSGGGLGGLAGPRRGVLRQNRSGGENARGNERDGDFAEHDVTFLRNLGGLVAGPGEVIDRFMTDLGATMGGPH